MDLEKFAQAYCVSFGIGCRGDVKKATELFKSNNCPESLHEYAKRLQLGVGTEACPKKALEIFLENWEKNHYKNSLYEYAKCFEKGVGCRMDEKKAFEFFGEYHMFNDKYPEKKKEWEIRLEKISKCVEGRKKR